MSDWRPDVLGHGFEATDLDLGEDDEGPVVATLVRSLPATVRPWWRWRENPPPLNDVDVLYLHGWSDYFFQRHLADFWTSRGARFFALDLRKYGRSIREGQTKGYIEHLTEYDLELAFALAEMGYSLDGASGAPGRRLVLMGHSTGGLIVSLWANRHPGIAKAIILNSPWLELQLTAAGRKALAPVVGLRAKLTPRDLALPQLDLGFYSRAQAEVGDPIEQRSLNREWRPEQSLPVLGGWLNAVLEGHARMEAGLEVGAPVCVLLSARTVFSLAWKPEMLSADTVIEVDDCARAALRLGSSVTVERIDGALHDVFLSAPMVRADAYARLDRWVCGWNASSR